MRRAKRERSEEVRVNGFRCTFADLQQFFVKHQSEQFQNEFLFLSFELLSDSRYDAANKARVFYRRLFFAVQEL